MMQIHVNPQPGPGFREIGQVLHPIEGALVRFCRGHHPIRLRARHLDHAPPVLPIYRHLAKRFDVPLRVWAQCYGKLFMHPALIGLIR